MSLKEITPLFAQVERGGIVEMIEMIDVWKSYPNGTDALKEIHIKIDKGEFVYVVGPSGAGKSTFIKLMYREERPTKGQIFLND